MVYIRITKDLLRVLINNNYKLWYGRISSDMKKLKQNNDMPFALSKTEIEDITTQLYLKSMNDDDFLISSISLSSAFYEYMINKKIEDNESIYVIESNLDKCGAKVSKVILKVLLFNCFSEYIKCNSIRPVKEANNISLKLALDEILYKNQLEKDFVLNKTLVVTIFEKHINSINLEYNEF